MPLRWFRSSSEASVFRLIEINWKIGGEVDGGCGVHPCFAFLYPRDAPVLPVGRRIESFIVPFEFPFQIEPWPTGDGCDGSIILHNIIKMGVWAWAFVRFQMKFPTRKRTKGFGIDLPLDCEAGYHIVIGLWVNAHPACCVCCVDYPLSSVAMTCDVGYIKIVSLSLWARNGVLIELSYNVPKDDGNFVEGVNEITSLGSLCKTFAYIEICVAHKKWLTRIFPFV